MAKTVNNILLDAMEEIADGKIRNAPVDSTVSASVVRMLGDGRCLVMIDGEELSAECGKLSLSPHDKVYVTRRLDNPTKRWINGASGAEAKGGGDAPSAGTADDMELRIWMLEEIAKAAWNGELMMFLRDSDGNLITGDDGKYLTARKPICPCKRGECQCGCTGQAQGFAALSTGDSFITTEDEKYLIL